MGQRLVLGCLDPSSTMEWPGTGPGTSGGPHFLPTARRGALAHLKQARVWSHRSPGRHRALVVCRPSFWGTFGRPGRPPGRTTEGCWNAAEPPGRPSTSRTRHGWGRAGQLLQPAVQVQPCPHASSSFDRRVTLLWPTGILWQRQTLRRWPRWAPWRGRTRLARKPSRLLAKARGLTFLSKRKKGCLSSGVRLPSNWKAFTLAVCYSHRPARSVHAGPQLKWSSAEREQSPSMEEQAVGHGWTGPVADSVPGDGPPAPLPRARQRKPDKRKHVQLEPPSPSRPAPLSIARWVPSCRREALPGFEQPSQSRVARRGSLH